MDNLFIDLFAGCGGLSLGLLNAGWKGFFAVEGNTDAFKTFKHNLIDRNEVNKGAPLYNWPEWMEQKHFEIGAFMEEYIFELKSLREKVKLIVGGPPCQGFSFAGRRNINDSRNELFKKYIEIVKIIQPDIVLIENVKGISVAHGLSEKRKKNPVFPRDKVSYLDRIIEGLNSLYDVTPYLVKSVRFGVPQYRPRYIVIGMRKGSICENQNTDIMELLEKKRKTFLYSKGLPERPISAREAMSDLETSGKSLRTCINHPLFKEIIYGGPLTSYQRLMHGKMNGKQPNSLRLPNHREETILNFKKIMSCPKGVTLSKENKEKLGIKKQAIVPLHPDYPSHTITTLPDDLIHYSEPRIHTVRENARLQSFPDWFEFKGKYTSGGKNRRTECPRYSQVGNAVPPLLAEALGLVLLDIVSGGEN